MSEQDLAEDRGGPAVPSAALDLAPVLFARGKEEAAHYCAVLEQACIPTLLGNEMEAGVTRLRGTPILVPETFHERASEIIALLDASHMDGDEDDDNNNPFDDATDDDDDDLFPDRDDDPKKEEDEDEFGDDVDL